MKTKEQGPLTTRRRRPPEKEVTGIGKTRADFHGGTKTDEGEAKVNEGEEFKGERGGRTAVPSRRRCCVVAVAVAGFRGRRVRV